jgi:hypothetical protein
MVPALARMLTVQCTLLLCVCVCVVPDCVLHGCCCMPEYDVYRLRCIVAVLPALPNEQHCMCIHATDTATAQSGTSLH